MRHVKPQSALVQTTPSQIGPQAFLGVAVGIGFRLGDPRVLVHEATVWEALELAPRSAPLTAPTLSKRHAEWLMMGHSEQVFSLAAAGRRVDWPCSIRVGKSTKTLSCAAVAQARPGAGCAARLATDHTLAARGTASENPVGTQALAPPLQLSGALGISPSAFAGTGPIDTDWPTRAQWMPRRPGTIEEIVRDGTHMGWPGRIDLRYFQLAAPNQWHEGRSWDTGSDYELRAVGPRGTGFKGRLPALAARVIYAARDSVAPLDMHSELQTLWFLPDHDLGVMWWTGSIPSEYFQDEQVQEMIVAFQDRDDEVAAEVFIDFARRRKDLQDDDPLLHADSVLMPSRTRGWTWEIITDASDHPRFGLAGRGHAETEERLTASLDMLCEASRRMCSANSLQESLVACQAIPRAAPPDRDWRLHFAAPFSAPLVDAVVADVDLRGIDLDGWQFKSTHFERCMFDAASWHGCHLEDVFCVDCSFKSTRFDACTWQGTTLRRCDLSAAKWHACHLFETTLDAIRLDEFQAFGGEWQQVRLTDARGSAGALRDLVIDDFVCTATSLPDWEWTALRTESIGLIKSHFDRLRLANCMLMKLSVVESSLVASRWSRCTVGMGVLGVGCSIEASSLTDCRFESTSWNELGAQGISVEHCHFAAFAGQGLDAVGSSWRRTVLEDTNAMHADFAGAHFDECAMKEIMLHGANLTKTRIQGCNMSGAKTGWALTSPRPAWDGNVEVGHLSIPRRNP